MTDNVSLKFDHVPSVLPFYLRVLSHWNKRSRKQDAANNELNITAHIEGVKVDQHHLVRYRKACGFKPSPYLPLTYPHVLAFPLQMAVMTHPRFPVSLMGLVHVRNTIVWYSALKVQQCLALTVSVDGYHKTTRGIEFNLVTKALGPDGRAVWEETSLMLSRSRASSKKKMHGKKPTPSVPGFSADETVLWDIPANIGRRYAVAAGDWNPIHLSRISARLFGLADAIATGMWLNARIAAALHAEQKNHPSKLDVVFEKPLPLPTRALFRLSTQGEGVEFALSRQVDTTPTADELLCVQGQLSTLDNSERLK